jgi:hypothetical protein
MEEDILFFSIDEGGEPLDLKKTMGELNTKTLHLGGKKKKKKKKKNYFSFQ